MIKFKWQSKLAALFLGAATLMPAVALAGSCCGGGSAAALMVPAYARAVADLSFDTELYDGFWNQEGKHTEDPPKSDLRQYRANLGYGQKLSKDWQASILVPYVWNDNRYSGLSSRTNGLGDTSLSIWYQAVEDQSSWRVRSVADMVPSVDLGVSLLLPTGISPYDDVKSSFDVTGRGFYRLDGSLLVEKGWHPWSASLALGYGTYFERSINREYGRYVEPYRKQLGDRSSASLSLGYRFIVGTGGDSLTCTASYAYLSEKAGNFNGARDDSSRFRKQSAGAAAAYSGNDSNWSLRAAWNHAIQTNGWGRNFPTTDIFTLGVRYVFL